MQELLLKNTRSAEIYEKALESIPGGVNSPVRSFKSVSMNPLFISKAKGPYIYDADDNQYIDYINSWGALLHGHSEKEVIQAIEKAASKGISFGASHESEIELATLIKSRMPNIEKIRFVNSGTEAVMTAIRLARAYTKRNKIIKFSGCYHGHSDSVLSNSGSGITTLGIPGSPGVTKSTASDTLTLPFNDLALVEITLCKYPKDIAAIIVEPVVGNCGVILPQGNFLNGLRELANKFKALLIFDEVMTGFRLAPGGAQGKFNIKPDLTTLGKIIGGGMPLAAVGGKSIIMDMLAPLGQVYQAGTLSGNPISVACGIANLNLITDETYKYLEDTSSYLCSEIETYNREKGIEVTINRCGSMFSIFFTSSPVYNEETAKTSNTNKFSIFFKEMLNRGIYLPPSQFESAFISTAIKENEVKRTLDAYKEAILKI